jgi:hypothetical protein
VFIVLEKSKLIRRKSLMGCYDSVLVPCPNCGEESEFQSKSGDCLCRFYKLDNCPADVIFDINRHSPNICEKCNTNYYVEFETYKPDNRTISVRNVKSVKWKDDNNYVC